MYYSDPFDLLINTFPIQDCCKGIYVREAMYSYARTLWYLGIHLHGALNYESEQFKRVLCEVTDLWSGGRHDVVLALSKEIIENARKLQCTCPSHWEEEFAFVLYVISVIPDYVVDNKLSLYGSRREVSSFDDDFRNTYNSMRGW